MARPAGRLFTKCKSVLMTERFRKKISYMAAMDGIQDTQLIRKAVAEYEKNFDRQRNDKGYLPGVCASDITGALECAG